MLRKTRVTSISDVNRMGSALGFPGIDPRVWTSLAIVQEIGIDEAEGVFVDVVLMPSEVEVTARLGVAYAGEQFGSYFPLRVDDEVLVTLPSGDPDNGFVISRRLHSASDPPPAEVVNSPDDVLVVHAAAGKTVRIVTEGGGNIVLDVKGEGEVLLANEAATDFVALASKVLSELQNIESNFNAHTHSGGGSGTPNTPITPAVGSVAAERTKAE